YTTLFRSLIYLIQRKEPKIKIKIASRKHGVYKPLKAETLKKLMMSKALKLSITPLEFGLKFKKSKMNKMIKETTAKAKADKKDLTTLVKINFPFPKRI